MKRFKNYLNEKHGYNTHDYYSENPAANGFASPEVQRKINAVLGKICQAGPYTMPEEAITKIRHSLGMMHLQFGQPDLSEDKGSLSLPLTAYGGRFGKLPDTPHNEFMDDDGLSDKIEGGLKLNFTYEKVEHNLFRIMAEIK